MPRQFNNGIDLNGQRGQNFADPTSPTDAANKEYVDALIQGLKWKPDVTASPTSNVTISNPGTAVFDGVTVSTGARLLLMNQTAPAENGIWVFATSSTALTRALDADSAAELVGAACTVDQGSTYGDKVYIQTVDTITLGTTSLTWTRLGGGTTYTGSTGINVSGTALTGVVKSGGGLAVDSSLGFSVDHTKVPLLYVTSIGDGSTNPITVTHNLGTLDVHVTIYVNSTGAEIETDVVHATTNTLTVTFGTTPTSNQYRVVVFG